MSKPNLVEVIVQAHKEMFTTVIRCESAKVVHYPHLYSCNYQGKCKQQYNFTDKTIYCRKEMDRGRVMETPNYHHVGIEK